MSFYALVIQVFAVILSYLVRRRPLIKAACTAWPVILMLTIMLPAGAFAQAAEKTVEIIDTEVAEETDADGSFDDAEGSLEDAVEVRGGSISADVRVSYNYADFDVPDITSEDIDLLRVRWRVGGAWGITERLRVAGRVAGICSSEDCNPDFYLRPESPTAAGIADGQITFDEMFLHWFRSDRWGLAAGRMQTKFVARGGVFAKSLDRNDSNNLRVNWTDGLHSTFKMRNGWNSHLILQHNSADGASNIRQKPLDFSDSRARTTSFLAFENRTRRPFLLQRGLDISYLPKSLLKDGDLDGRREDYWGIVGRVAGRWPMRSEGPRLRFSSEFGYAPNTQTRAAAGLAGDGDVAGWA